MNQPRPYTVDETAYIRAHYATASRADILAAVPDHAWHSIQKKAAKLAATGRPMVVPIKERTSWHPANVALLHALYPTGGTPAVVAATGLTANAVRSHAVRLGLRFVAQHPARAPRPYRPRNTPKVAVVKMARTQRPLPPLPPIKPPRASTPNVNAAMSRKRLAGPVVSITADQIRQLDYNHPARMAYLHGGITGWQQWKAAQ